MVDGYESTARFDHERLDAYTIAVALDAQVVALARRALRGHAWLGDQAQRASASVVLNLAEGSQLREPKGEWEHAAGQRASGGSMGREGADRARTLRIARGSALEVDAALTLLLARGACNAASRVEARRLNLRLVAMLTKLRDREAASPAGWDHAI